MYIGISRRVWRVRSRTNRRICVKNTLVNLLNYIFGYTCEHLGKTLFTLSHRVMGRILKLWCGELFCVVLLHLYQSFCCILFCVVSPP